MIPTFIALGIYEYRSYHKIHINWKYDGIGNYRYLIRVTLHEIWMVEKIRVPGFMNITFDWLWVLFLLLFDKKLLTIISKVLHFFCFILRGTFTQWNYAVETLVDMCPEEK